MGVSKYFRYEPRVFRAGEITAALKDVLASVFPPEYAAGVSIFRTLPDGTDQSLHRRSLDDLADVCDLDSQASATVEFGRSLGSVGVAREVELRLGTDRESFLWFYISAIDPEQLDRFSRVLEAKLELITAPPPAERRKAAARDGVTAADGMPSHLEEALEQLTMRVRAVERHQRSSVVLTCFLSFQFVDVSLEYARVVRQFLELIGVTVVTGQGYEPRQVQDKVRQRIRTGIDFVVLIEIADRKSSWTRDEIAITQTPGVFLIPLVEEGAAFDRGIYGDHEYVPFARGHIGDAFIGLLQGIEFIRATRASESLAASAGE